MFNPYSIILGMFIVFGLLAILWGLRVIAMARKTLQWPTVEGTIEESALASESDDLLPHIKYSYRVNEKTFHQLMRFSGDVTPSQEFSQSYVKRFPVGLTVSVYHDPENPEVSTLEPGLGKGDWLILAIGLGMLVLGVVLFLIA